ncbi:RT0821/Lpp0805 family surface protein [Faunimonas pinastri]|nr:RT0821/Lpp0805 family surface protein [Faunimonas pinastri]
MKLSSDDTKPDPIVTGSIATPVEVGSPLPQTLAYSDAKKIGTAGSAILFESGAAADVTAKKDWINAETGSSGTMAPEAHKTAATEPGCKPFETTVTSFGGVHHYSGTICKSAMGTGAVVRIDPA